MNDPLKITVIDQNAILKELGISPTAPGAQTQARKITTDFVVLDRAMQLAIRDRIPQVIAAMSPAERERLKQRTSPTPVPTAKTTWTVSQGTVMQEIHIFAQGTRWLGEQHTVIGEQFFTGTPERAKFWRPFNEVCPPEVVAEYKRAYAGPLMLDSAQAHVYGNLSGPDYGPLKAPDLSHCPGPNFAGTSDRPDTRKPHTLLI